MTVTLEQLESADKAHPIKTKPTYEFWQQSIAGNAPSIHESDPQPGFYVKKAYKDDPAKAVAIWFDEVEVSGSIVAVSNGKQVDADDLWTWVAANPISHSEYNHAMETGEFPDRYRAKSKKEPEPKKEPEEAPTPQPVMNAAPPPNIAATDSPPIGHNSEQVAGIEFAEQMKAEAALVKELIAAGCENQEQADKLGECGNRLLKLKKNADAERKRLKQPHIDAGKAVDEAFTPTINSAADRIKELRGVVGGWKAKEEARLREEVEKERQAQQAEADRKAREEAELSGASSQEVEQAKGEEVKAKKVEVKSGTAAGKSFGAAPKQYEANILDYDALLESIKHNPKIMALVSDIANEAARKNKPLPFTERVEKKG